MAKGVYFALVLLGIIVSAQSMLPPDMDDGHSGRQKRASIFQCHDLDADHLCYDWAVKGHCKTSEAYMEIHCNHTCNFCARLIPKKPTTQKPVDTALPCHDWDEDCVVFASTGKCTVGHSVAYMKKSCRASCGWCPCGDKNTKCPQWAKDGHCTTGQYVTAMKKNCKKACGLCGGVKVVCLDKDKDCNKWSNEGHCTNGKFVTFMKNNCKVSCGTCFDSCKDDHPKCQLWSSQGECDKNTGYMHKSCRRSCKICFNPYKPVPVAIHPAGYNRDPVHVAIHPAGFNRN